MGSMLRNPSEFTGGHAAFPGRVTEANPDICHTLASPPGGISGVPGGPAARYGDGKQNTLRIPASEVKHSFRPPRGRYTLGI